MARGGAEQAQGKQSLIAKAGIVALTTLLVAAMLVAVALAAYPKRVAQAVSVADVDLSLQPLAKAEETLNAWWEERAERELVLVGPSDEAEPVSVTPRELGIEIDVFATLAQLPYDDLRGWMGRNMQGEDLRPVAYPMVFDYSKLDVERLQAIVAETSPRLAPAKARLDDEGEIVLTPEVSSMKLVEPATKLALATAITSGELCKIAAVYGKKNIADDELHKIKDVVSTFSTKFSASDRTRAQNLKVAAEKLDGVVLLSGETFSFNEFVGERTPENGFFKAGVYRRGRHEIDFGGGVCQVSTTLCNAVVYANLKVEKRSNHTFLVPYVPAGRDAAVAYGELDFVFTNTHDAPIAIDAKWEPGKLTFSVLGVKEEGLEIELIPVITSSWEHPVEYVDDPNLKPSEEVEIEKGGKGYRATTTRVVRKNGEEVSREVLFKSYYKGGPQIIARGPKREAPREPVLPPIEIGF